MAALGPLSSGCARRINNRGSVSLLAGYRKPALPTIKGTSLRLYMNRGTHDAVKHMVVIRW